MIYAEQDKEIKSTYLEQKTFATSEGKISATHKIQKEKTKHRPKSQVFDKIETQSERVAKKDTTKAKNFSFPRLHIK